MTPEMLSKSLTITDLSDPKNGLHAINIIVEKVRTTLEKAFVTTPIEVYRTPPLVNVQENFDMLLFPTDNAGRSSRYTRYADTQTVLRTHTSAAIPGWLKSVRVGLEDKMVLTPGICYRRDVVDKNHCGEPHQMDVWRIKRGEPRLERPALINLIEVLISGVIPGYEYRANEVKHPYTINGLEVEILVKEEWLEILECGEIHPTILRNAGINPEEYSGLAMGMGLDRLVMIIKGIDDIRTLRSEDPRISKQMLNIDRYTSVSNQPATKRVLSYSASADKNIEDVCEALREVLGPNTSCLEKVEVQIIPYTELLEKARKNLGIKPDQVNIVTTLTFRSVEKSLPKEVVNSWMKDIYPKLNEGTTGYM